MLIVNLEITRVGIVDEGQNQTSAMPVEKHKNFFAHRNVIALILVIVVAVGVGIYAETHHKKTPAPPSPWATYTNKQHGFKLDYLKAWGAPSFSSTDFLGGKKYTLTFTSPDSINTNKKKHPLYQISRSITMVDTKEVAGCVAKGSQCGGQFEAARDYIKAQLASRIVDEVAHDSSSYAQVNTFPKYNVQSILEIYQIVNLPGINVSGAYGNLSYTGPQSSCVNGQFLAGEEGCITSSDYDTFHQSLSSISKI